MMDFHSWKDTLKQGWAIDFSKGPREKLGLLCKADWKAYKHMKLIEVSSAYRYEPP